ncbi:rhodanese-like domain-containing protein [Nocardioides campestrisoli]|uniref:rhodanese-like domain-containing protein n=1 Tax=Nocardioides campestrisoli TaxID=2736757 RepID=UPI00163D8214|nr:rhodanese-like domain-containing protein [Nocardioides campestrisoli]
MPTASSAPPSTPPAATDPVSDDTLVAASRVRELLDDPTLEVAVLDLRTPQHRSEGHLAASTGLPFHDLEQRITLLVPRRETPVVLVADDAALAETARTVVHGLGYRAVSVLDGGTAGWTAAGGRLHTGTNVRSKTLGEWIEERFGTPTVDPETVAGWRAAGEEVVVLDSRPHGEYLHHHIPGGLDTGGGPELAYRGLQAVARPGTRIVVNCAGRTRGIVGAQSLINTGIPYEVYSLRNGTPAWGWAGLPLEHGPGSPLPAPAETTPELRAWARRTLEEAGATLLDAPGLAELRTRPSTIYVVDIRSPQEVAAGTVAGARAVQGGQLVQATDEHVAVHRAALVLVDTADLVRAAGTVQWLRFLHDGPLHVVVHEAGLAGEPARSEVPLPDVPRVTPAELGAELGADPEAGPLVVDLRSSAAYRAAHLPGSVHARREQLADLVTPATATVRRVVLVGDGSPAPADAARDLQATTLDVYRPHFAAGDLLVAGVDVRVLDGDPHDVPLALTDEDPVHAGEIADQTGPPPFGPERDAWYRAYFDWEYSLVPGAQGDPDLDFERTLR